MNRRDFSKFALGGFGVAIGGGNLRPEGASLISVEKPKMDIIDTHLHLWNRSKFTLPWITKGTTLDADFGIPEYKVASGGVVTRTVYMEVDVEPSQQWDEAVYVNGLCNDPMSGMVAAVVSGRPNSPDFEKWVERLGALKGVRGIRQVLHVPSTPRGYCLESNFVKGIKLLGAKNLSFDLCIKDVDLAEKSKLVEQCPETQFILDHCGNPDLKKADLSPWKKDIEEISRHKNLVIKISGFLASAPAKDQWKFEDAEMIINHCLDSFGPERCIFGGDWPVVLLGSTLLRWIDTVKQVVSKRPIAEQEKLFSRNAERLYRLTPA